MEVGADHVIVLVDIIAGNLAVVLACGGRDWRRREIPYPLSGQAHFQSGLYRDCRLDAGLWT